MQKIGKLENWKIGKLENWKIGKFKFLNNKQLAVLITVAFATPSVCVAQTRIEFDYDGFGNRVHRYVPTVGNSTKSYSFEENDSLVVDMPETATELNNSINVYPNPTADYLYIDINSLKNCSYQLSNAKGVVLEKARLQKNVIDMSGYVSGIYHLTIERDDVKEIFEVIKE